MDEMIILECVSNVLNLKFQKDFHAKRRIIYWGERDEQDNSTARNQRRELGKDRASLSKENRAHNGKAVQGQSPNVEWDTLDTGDRRAMERPSGEIRALANRI